MLRGLEIIDCSYASKKTDLPLILNQNHQLAITHSLYIIDQESQFASTNFITHNSEKFTLIFTPLSRHFIREPEIHFRSLFLLDLCFKSCMQPL